MNNTDIQELTNAQIDEVVFVLGEMPDGTLRRMTPPMHVPLKWLIIDMYPHFSKSPPPKGWVTIPKRMLQLKDFDRPKKMIKIHTAMFHPTKLVSVCLPLADLELLSLSDPFTVKSKMNEE